MTLAPPPEIPGHKCVDVVTLPQTYPLRGRILMWLLWRTPLRWISRRFGRSPYAKLVGIYAPVPKPVNLSAEKVEPKVEPQAEKSAATEGKP